MKDVLPFQSAPLLLFLGHECNEISLERLGLFLDERSRCTRPGARMHVLQLPSLSKKRLRNLLGIEL